MNDLILSDEEIWGKESSEVEIENNKLKMRIININDKLEISEYALEKIEELIKNRIKINLSKTKMCGTPAVIKVYREELLVLREIEKELTDYYERIKEYEKKK